MVTIWGSLRGFFFGSPVFLVLAGVEVRSLHYWVTMEGDHPPFSA